MPHILRQNYPILTFAALCMVLALTSTSASAQQLKNLRKSKPAESYECQRAKAALQALIRTPGYHYGMDAQGIANMDCWYAIMKADLYTDFKTDAELKAEAEQARRDREDAEEDAQRDREEAAEDARRAREEAAEDAAREAKRAERRRSWPTPAPRTSPGFGRPTNPFGDPGAGLGQPSPMGVDPAQALQSHAQSIQSQTYDLEDRFYGDPNMLLDRDAVERRIASLERQITANDEGAITASINGLYDMSNAMYEINGALQTQIDTLRTLQRASDRREQDAYNSDPSLLSTPTPTTSNAYSDYGVQYTPGSSQYPDSFTPNIPMPPPPPDPEIARRAAAQANADRVGSLLDIAFGDPLSPGESRLFDNALGSRIPPYGTNEQSWNHDLASLDEFTNTFTTPNASKPLVSIADMTAKAPPPARLDASGLEGVVTRFNTRSAEWPPRTNIAIDALADDLGVARPYGSSGPSMAEYGQRAINIGGETGAFAHNQLTGVAGEFMPQRWNSENFQFESDGGPGLLGTAELVSDKLERKLPLPVRGASKLMLLSDLKDWGKNVVGYATEDSRVEASERLNKLRMLREEFVRTVESNATPGTDPWNWSSPNYKARSEINNQIRILEESFKVRE
ncbi:MAG: hypothetical protein KDA29_14605 [Phycisphaerales bacterium]|nr:hypothetical protein [Phycisphaerales bacterium]